MPTPRPAAPAPWALPPAEVLADVQGSPDGLTRADAQTRLTRDGPNELAAPKRQPAWRRFLVHFDNVLVYILIAAAVLKAITGDWVDFAVIAVVIVANALIGFIQEGRATSALASLRSMVSLDAQVLRDGAWSVVDAGTLVVGDIVRVRSGDRVPADMRLLSESNLQVDEAALTGESEPSAKDIRPVGADAGVGDRSCLLFSGTIVTVGNGEGVVVAIGADTEIGRISAMVAEVDDLDTPLTRQLAHLGKQLSILRSRSPPVMLVIGRVIHNFAVDESDLGGHRYSRSPRCPKGCPHW